MLHLLYVAQSRGKPFLKLLRHFHAVAREIVASQFDGLPQNAVDLHQFTLYRPLPRKAQQILHNVFRALGFLQDNLEILLCRRRHIWVLQQEIRKP